MTTQDLRMQYKAETGAKNFLYVWEDYSFTDWDSNFIGYSRTEKESGLDDITINEKDTDLKTLFPEIADYIHYLESKITND